MAWLNAMGDSVRKNLTTLFDEAVAAAAPPPSGTGSSPQRKKRAGAAESGDLAMEDATAAGEPVVTCAWLKQALGESQMVMGRHIQGELSRIEAKANEAATSAGAAKQEVDQLRGEVKTLRDEVLTLRGACAGAAEQAKRCQQQVAEAAAAPRAATARRGEQSPEDKELSDRTARFGNVGWDTEADILLARVQDALRQAQCSDKCRDLMAVTDRRTGLGSACEAVFDTAADLKAARIKLRGLRLQQPGCDRPLWVDKKKTHEEMGPSRVLGALTSSVKELEEARQDTKTVERSNFGRCVKVDNKKYFAVREDGSVVPGSLARARYTDEEIADATGWAQAAF